MKTFDIQKFERKKDNKGEYSFVEKELLITMKDYGDKSFREEIRSVNKKNLKKIIVYSKITGKQTGEYEQYLNLDTGKSLIYDENGNVVKIYDYTRPNFKFSLEQLAEKMLKDYGIDMYNADNIKLEDSTRLDQDGKPIVEWWVIVETRENNTYNFKTYRINGTSGELISIEKGIFGGIN